MPVNSEASHLWSGAGDKPRRVQMTVRPFSGNPYLSAEHPTPWASSLLRSYGDSCHRMTRINGFHVLLCAHRVFVISEGTHFLFPPFSAVVTDAYVETMCNGNMMVVVGLVTGVHVAVIRLGDPPVRVESEVFAETSAPVARIHRLNRSSFAVCLKNCRVQTMQVWTEPAGSPGIALLSIKEGWLQTAVEWWKPRNYRDSFFDGYTGGLAVLSQRDVVFFSCGETTDLRVAFSSQVPNDAVAILPSRRRNILGTLVLRSGTRIGLRRLEPNRRDDRDGPALEFCEAEQLPDSVKVTRVSRACQGANTTVLFDDATTSVVFISEAAPLLSGVGSPEATIVSELTLSTKVLGLSFEGKPATNKGVFWFYGKDEVALTVHRASPEAVLCKHIAESRVEAHEVLKMIDPVRRTELLLVSATEDGLPIGEAFSGLKPLFVPRLVDPFTVRLSSGAEGLAIVLVRDMEEIAYLCSAFHYGELAGDLNRLKERVLRCCEVSTDLLHRDGWLDCPTSMSLEWLDFEGTSKTPLTQRTAINAQAQFLNAALRRARDAGTIGWLYSLLIETNGSPHLPGPLMDILWNGDVKGLEMSLCMELLALRNAELVQKLATELHLLPPDAQLAVQVHVLLREGASAAALSFATEHVEELANVGLLPYVMGVLEMDAPDLLPTVHLLARHCRTDALAADKLLAALGTLAPTSEALRRSLVCFFEQEHWPSVQTLVLDWMMSHPLDDERIPIFLSVIADLRIPVEHAHSMTGKFFSCWYQEVHGNRNLAARRFSELARAPSELPLKVRLTCLDHAMLDTPSDSDKLAQFVLLLQGQLARLLEKQIEEPDDLFYPRDRLEADLHHLLHHYMDEKELYEMSGRYDGLGGASIQLDLLKIHPDSPEAITCEAIISVLTFLKVIGIPPESAVERVLREYLSTFQAPLPIYPFAEFLAFNGSPIQEIAALLAANGVAPITIFDILLGMLDGRYGMLSTAGAVSHSLQRIVMKLSGDQRQVCRAHLLECIRSILAGEHRPATLTETDVQELKEVEGALKGLAL